MSCSSSPALTAHLRVRPDQPGARIPRELYGHFAEHLGTGIYDGIWVGEDSPIPHTGGLRTDVLDALRALDVPVLRWPGGCFADEYHWKDGIGPRAQRPRMMNTHWGAVTENNHFGTHEFMHLCAELRAEPYVCGNVGSGSVQEMMEWVEYLTSDADTPMADLRRRHGRHDAWALRYFGVGNESWGCGGNMRPEYYADQFRRYHTFVKNYGRNRLVRIACGANADDFVWTEKVLAIAHRQMDALSLHYYTVPTGQWQEKGPALGFDEDAWHATLRRALQLETLIQEHGAIMDRFDPEKRIAMVVDEWGTWYDPDPGSNPGFLRQQNSLRDALVAALSLHVFHRHTARVRMANIAQTVNVLQAMLFTDGPRLVRTPTYWTFEMLKVHQGAALLPLDLQTPHYTRGGETIPAVSATATRPVGESGWHLSLVNCDPERSIDVHLHTGTRLSAPPRGRVLTGEATDAHNTFAAPDRVRPRACAATSPPEDATLLSLPPKSVVVFEID